MITDDYKVEADVRGGDLLVLITDDRARAQFYAGVLLNNKVYTQVRVVFGNRMYTGEAIGRMP